MALMELSCSFDRKTQFFGISLNPTVDEMRQTEAKLLKEQFTFHH